MVNVQNINNYDPECSIGTEEINFYVLIPKHVRESMRKYIEKEKYHSLVARASTIRANRQLRKEKKNLLCM